MYSQEVIQRLIQEQGRVNTLISQHKDSRKSSFSFMNTLESYIDQRIQAAIAEAKPKDGIDAYTPVKGKDYFTFQEIKAIEDHIKSLIPKKGKDYFTEKEKQEMLSAARPKKGKDYFTLEELSGFQEQIKSIIPSKIFQDEKDIQSYIEDGLPRITAESYVEFGNHTVNEKGEYPTTKQFEENIEKNVVIKKIGKAKGYLATFNEAKGAGKDVIELSDDADRGDFLHEKVHAWVAHTSSFNSFRSEFQKRYEKLKKTNEGIRIIDEMLSVDPNYDDASDEDMVEERYANVAQMFGRGGIEAIPKPLRKFYDDIFESENLQDENPAGISEEKLNEILTKKKFSTKNISDLENRLNMLRSDVTRNYGGHGMSFHKEIAGEVVSGSGTSWTLANIPSLFRGLYAQGQKLSVSRNDFTISGKSITTTNSWSAGDLEADYYK